MSGVLLMQNILIVFVFVLFLAACTPEATKTGATAAQSQVVEAAKSGGLLYVACRNLPLHTAANGYSEALTLIRFGVPVRVLGTAGETFVAGQTLPVWAKVQLDTQQGFVASRCLVSQALLDQQDPAQANRKAAKGSTVAAARGFSEDEDFDLIAMRGAAGKAQGGRADYATLDRFLTASAEYNPVQHHRDFRRKGRLGEFQ
jgi:hypothetical protein